MLDSINHDHSRPDAGSERTVLRIGIIGLKYQGCSHLQQTELPSYCRLGTFCVKKVTWDKSLRKFNFVKAVSS